MPPKPSPATPASAAAGAGGAAGTPKKKGAATTPKTAASHGRAAGVFKGAIKKKNAMALFYEWDSSLDLADVVLDVCGRFNVQEPDDWALFLEGPDTFLTDKNVASLLKDGFILELRLAPDVDATKTIDQLLSDKDTTQRNAAAGLPEKMKSQMFADEFLANDGVDAVVKLVESSAGGTLAYAMQAFQMLMALTPKGWGKLSERFIAKVSQQIQDKNEAIGCSALGIITALLASPKYSFKKMYPHIDQQALVTALDSGTERIQLAALTLVNNLLISAPDAKKRIRAHDALNELGLRKALTNVQRKAGPANLPLAHQLYVNQQLTINMLEFRRDTPYDPANKRHVALMQHLSPSFVEGEGAQRKRDSVVLDGQAKKPRSTAAWKKLGFPSDDVAGAFSKPPGILALSWMAYFAKSHSEPYRKLVLEQAAREGKECPFARASLALTSVLCELLKVGAKINDEATEYHPMFFSCDNPYKEFFCQAITLLNRTWREMEATEEDFDKVVDVVRRQTLIILEYQGDEQPVSMDAFRLKSLNLSYKSLLAQELKGQAEAEYAHFKSEPVKVLRGRLHKKVLDEASNQRLGYLMDGAAFPKYNNKGRVKSESWFVLLSTNKKFLAHGDYDEQQAKKPAYEQLPNKVDVGDIKLLQTGADCDFIKQWKKAPDDVVSMAFSLVLGNEETLDFVAPNEQARDIWTDGLRLLLGYQPENKSTLDDVQQLLRTEMKLRLLNVEDVAIPDEPPEVPPLPPHFNFVCHGEGYD